MAAENRISGLPQVHGEATTDDATSKASPPCTNCGALAPTVDSDSSLISKQGWRLVLETDATGRRLGAWSCPTCWSRRRSASRSSIRSQ